MTDSVKYLLKEILFSIAYKECYGTDYRNLLKTPEAFLSQYDKEYIEYFSNYKKRYEEFRAKNHIKASSENYFFLGDEIRIDIRALLSEHGIKDIQLQKDLFDIHLEKTIIEPDGFFNRLFKKTLTQSEYTSEPKGIVLELKQELEKIFSNVACTTVSVSLEYVANPLIGTSTIFGLYPECTSASWKREDYGPSFLEMPEHSRHVTIFKISSYKDNYKEIMQICANVLESDFDIPIDNDMYYSNASALTFYRR